MSGVYALSDAAVEAIKAALQSSLDEVRQARHDFPPAYNFEAALEELNGGAVETAVQTDEEVELVLRKHLPVATPWDAVLCLCDTSKTYEGPVPHRKHVAAALREAGLLREAEPEPFTCAAEWRHGPGHQSVTRCNRPGKHGIDDYHYVVEAVEEWRGAETRYTEYFG